MTSRAEVMFHAYQVQYAAQRAFAREFGYGMIWGGDPSLGAVMQAAEAGYGSVPAYIDGLTEGIPAWFERFLERDPATLDGMVVSLTGVQRNLQQNVLSRMDALETDLASWDGRAAVNFRRYFVDNFDSFRDHQVMLVEELTRALKVMQEALEHSRRDLIRIAEDTVKALNALEFGGRDGSALVLTALAAAVGVVAAPFTGGGSLAVTFALVGGTLSVAASYSDYRTQPISGDSTQEVLNSLSGALGSVRDQMDIVEDALRVDLANDRSMLKSDFREFVAPRPLVADIDDVEDFRPNI